MPAGSPVVRLLPPQNVKVRFFVPEAVAGGLKPGRSVAIHCDGCGADVPAVVSYVSTEPEYTPPVIYSNETRASSCSWSRRARRSRTRRGCAPGSRSPVTLQ